MRKLPLILCKEKKHANEVQYMEGRQLLMLFCCHVLKEVMHTRLSGNLCMRICCQKAKNKKNSVDGRRFVTLTVYLLIFVSLLHLTKPKCIIFD